MSEVLRLENITRRYKEGEGQLEVFSGLDLSLKAGEIVALVGQSGAGKSSLLHIAGLLEAPTSGEIHIEGIAASRLPDFSAVTLELRPDAVPDLAQSGRPFDANSVKRDFPILQTQVHGKPLIWLDNAATTQKPQAVIDRLSHFYEHENSNIHRAAHALAARATDAYEGAREKVRRFLNAGSTRDIVTGRALAHVLIPHVQHPARESA